MAIRPITDLLDAHGENLLKVIPEQQWDIMRNADGEIMGIPRSTPTSPYITWVRQDWLDELGMDVPTTWDELEATIEAFQAHNPEAFIATRPGDIRWSTLGGFTPNGHSNWLDPDDGKVKPWVLQPGVLDWVTELNSWWEAGYFYLDSFTSYDAPEVFRTCNLGVWQGWYSRITLITHRSRAPVKASNGLAPASPPIWATLPPPVRKTLAPTSSHAKRQTRQR